MTIPPTPTYKFYFVQRLHEHADPLDLTVEGQFKLELMQSNEFQRDGTADALTAFRRASTVDTRTIEMTHRNVTRTVYLIGDPVTLDAKVRDFGTWVNGATTCYSVEDSLFAAVFLGTQEPWVRTNAWWSLRDEVAWTFDEDMAVKLRSAFAG